MNKIDVRLNKIEMFKSLIGKEMANYEHEPFKYTNSVSQFVRFNIDGNPWYIYCFTEELDYFGVTEDVSVLSVDSKEYSFFTDKQCISIPVQEIIKKIIIIQENQKLFEHDEQVYDVWLTRGIVFDFGSYQLSFEKGAWLSEQIIIRKGYDLVSEVTPISKVTDGFTENVTMQCNRQIITVE